MGDVYAGAADVTVLNDAPASTGRDALLDLLEMAGSDDDGSQHDDDNNNDEEDPWDRDARGGHRGYGGQAKDNAHNDEEELDTTLVGESVMVVVGHEGDHGKPRSPPPPPPPPPPQMFMNAGEKESYGDNDAASFHSSHGKSGMVEKRTSQEMKPGYENRPSDSFASSPPPPPPLPTTQTRQSTTESIVSTSGDPKPFSTMSKTPGKRPFLKKGSRSWNWAASAKQRKAKEAEKKQEHSEKKVSWQRPSSPVRKQRDSDTASINVYTSSPKVRASFASQTNYMDDAEEVSEASPAKGFMENLLHGTSREELWGFGHQALDEAYSYDDDDDHHYQNGGNRGSHENGSNRGSYKTGSKRGSFSHFAKEEEFGANNNANDDDDEEEEEEEAEEYAEMSWKRPVREHAPQSQLVRRMFRTLDPEDDVESEEEEEASAANKSVVPASASANAEFTAKLQEEMDRFKETNERLQVSLKQLEVDRRHLVQERLELDKEKRQLGKESDAQVEQMRAEVRKERALLQRERVALERQKQHIEVLRETARVERKDRGQVDSLQATIARMRLAEKEKAVKHKEAMQSKRERISVLEREAEQMQSALRFAEERRLDLWGQLTQAQEKIESGEAERKQLAQALESIRASSAVTPTSQSFVSPLREPTSDGRRSRDEHYIDHNNGLEDEKTGEPLYAQQARLAEAEPSPHGPSPEAECDPSERVVHIPGQTAGPKVAVGALTHVEHSAKQSRKTTSQRRQRVHPDGSRTIKFADGTVKEISPDGEQTVTFSNGDIKKKIPREGLEIYYFAASDTSQTTYADGMVVCEFPNGQVERKHPSGVQEIFYVDGAVKTVNADGSEETLFSDGTKLEISSSGQRRVLRPVEALPSGE